MSTIFAKYALLDRGWAQRVRVTCKGTLIDVVQADAEPQAGDVQVQYLLPALGNVHSHAFQRAMAGMTEYRGQSADNFWTWRDLMYRFVNVLKPDEIEAIAEFAYLEMLEAGFSAVGEFHYVHHQPDGTPYQHLPELTDRIFSAARSTGIGLTHLPSLYAFGDVGGKPLQGGQRRFGCTLEQFARIVLHADQQARSSMPDDTRVGIAPHSLRAVTPELLNELLTLVSSDAFVASSPGTTRTHRPIHIHAAEQFREVELVERTLGALPVEWLLDHCPVAENWCLIHATHLTEREINDLAQSGAVVGLCPITESNLGDGIFPARSFLQAGGKISVGSDSNVHISVAHELRTLEYSQRLAQRERNVLAINPGSTGEQIFRHAAIGGAQALARNAGTIATGKLADLVALNLQHNGLAHLTAEQSLSGWIFSGDRSNVTDVWSAGRHCIQSGQHQHGETIRTRYQQVMHAVAQRL